MRACVFFPAGFVRKFIKSFPKRYSRRLTSYQLCSRSKITVCVLLVILQAFYMMRTKSVPKTVITLSQDTETSSDQCMEVHVAVPANGYYERQRLSILIKSVLLYSRHVILHLHLLVDAGNKKRIETLLTTWDLPHVIPHYYENDRLLSDMNSLVEIAGYFIRNKNRLIGVNKMILAKCDVYFTDDVSVLWYNLEAVLLDEMIAILESESRNPEKFRSDGVMLLNLDQTNLVLSTLKPQCDNASLLFTKDPMSTSGSRALISVICRTSSGHWDQVYDRQVHIIPAIGTAVLFPVYVTAPSARSIEYDIIAHIEQFNGDVFRQMTPTCILRKEPRTMSKNLCDVYPLIATMPRRTHTHYISNVPDNTKYLTTDVTLVTQLMINRIDNLERLLDAWKGPSQVALYLTDEELITFKDFYDHSSILKRANATYHVIFKRHVLYPINYVRNVAIRATKTPFYIMIDVDFAAQPSLYPSILSYVRQLKPNEKKVFIVPVFETPLKLYQLPATKEQLIKDLDANLLIPYHQVPGTWTKGHERTDYSKWRISNSTYEVEWEFGFEPYVVVPTSEFVYDEVLVERMRDKLIYTVNIQIKGYSLHVLPFDYLIHTPHKKSDSYLYSDKTFLYCARIVYEKVIRELRKGHQPSVIL